MKKIKIDYSFIILWSALYCFDEDGLLPIFFISAAIHEVGHYTVLKILNGKLIFLRLSAFGAEMRISKQNSYLYELLILLAGPIFNLLFAYVFSKFKFDLLAGSCVILGLFNLLPAQPLDGGKILENLLYLSPLEHFSEIISRVISFFIALSVLLLGVLIVFYTKRNITVFLIGVFLIIGQIDKHRQNL